MKWIKSTASIEERVIVAVVRAATKGEGGVGTPEKSVSNRLVDEGASLNAPNKALRNLP